jgi:hypothetical protein
MNEDKRYSSIEIELKRLQVARDTEKGQRELALMKQQIDLNSGQAQAAISAIDRHYDQLVDELESRIHVGTAKNV